MTKQTILISLSLLFSCLLFAQDKIETDRPTEAQSAILLAKGTFQAEIGVLKDQENKQDDSWEHPNVVFRYGLLNRLELRLRLTEETDRNYTENKFNHGLQPVELGMKANLYHTEDTSFSLSLYGQIGIPKVVLPITSIAM